MPEAEEILKEFEAEMLDEIDTIEQLGLTSAISA